MPPPRLAVEACRLHSQSCCPSSSSTSTCPSSPPPPPEPQPSPPVVLPQQLQHVHLPKQRQELAQIQEVGPALEVTIDEVGSPNLGSQGQGRAR